MKASESGYEREYPIIGDEIEDHPNEWGDQRDNSYQVQRRHSIGTSWDVGSA